VDTKPVNSQLTIHNSSTLSPIVRTDDLDRLCVIGH
jgi:hypothetical protein